MIQLTITALDDAAWFLLTVSDISLDLPVVEGQTSRILTDFQDVVCFGIEIAK